MASARAITRSNRLNEMFTRAVSFYGAAAAVAVLERPIVAQGCDRSRRTREGRFLSPVLAEGGGQGLAHVVTKRLRREDFDVRRVAHQEQAQTLGIQRAALQQPAAHVTGDDLIVRERVFAQAVVQVVRSEERRVGIE